MRAITFNIRDTTLGIWQDDPNDPTFRPEIYGGVIRLLRDRGWRVRADPEVKRRHPCLSQSHRLARKGALEASVEIIGRHVELVVWAATWPLDNPNGPRYDFGKRERMTFLDRLRFDLLTRNVREWLEGRAAVTVEDGNVDIKCGPGALTAMEFIAVQYAESCHSDRNLGRPVCRYAYNSVSGDGGTVEHGATVWFEDRKGRICRGTAFYSLNNMWWVVAGRYCLTKLSSHRIHVRMPADLRRKRNERVRRERLERELSGAIQRMHFERAALLRDILFGGEPTFLIWSRERSAYYRVGSRGYTYDAIHAGRFTRAEAEAECQRVPHILSMVCPDGSHVRFDKAVA